MTPHSSLTGVDAIEQTHANCYYMGTEMENGI